MRAVVCALLLFCGATPVAAAWNRASSRHFVIYADQGPDTLRKFAEKLEKFDGAVRAVRGMDDLPPSLGNRVTVFALKNAEEVQRLMGDKTGFVQGFYLGRAEGSSAFIPQPSLAKAPRIGTGTHLSADEPSTKMGGDVVLLHEYSHHLMFQDLNVPYPQWLVEGFAEFMSTAQFEADGSVGLGLPAGHRMFGLISAEGLPLATLLSGRYEKITEGQMESIYGTGWLLTHYLTFEPSRKGQLKNYLDALAKGTEPLEAARQSFGDIGKLDHDLTNYQGRSRLEYLKISGRAVAVPAIDVTPVSQGGAAVLPLLAELRSNMPNLKAADLAARIHAVEARFPGDELVETTLAEAEVEADDAEGAQIAADRALSANPRNTKAMVLKGKAIELRATKADRSSAPALFDQARQNFIAANKIDAEDPEPLSEYYRAYVQQRIPPTANAIAALHYASDLAPQDSGLRMMSAEQYLIDGKPADARRTLPPIAYDPHGKELASAARKMIERIDAGDIKGALAAAAETAKN